MKELEEMKSGIKKQAEEIRKFKHENFSLMKDDEFSSAVTSIEYNLVCAKTKLDNLISFMSEGVSESV